MLVGVNADRHAAVALLRCRKLKLSLIFAEAFDSDKTGWICCSQSHTINKKKLL